MHLVFGGPEHGAGHRLLAGEAVALESAVGDDPCLRIDLANDASGERAVPSTEVEKLVPVRQGVQLVDDIGGGRRCLVMASATSLSQPSSRSYLGDPRVDHRDHDLAVRRREGPRPPEGSQPR